MNCDVCKTEIKEANFEVTLCHSGIKGKTYHWCQHCTTPLQFIFPRGKVDQITLKQQDRLDEQLRLEIRSYANQLKEFGQHIGIDLNVGR